MKFKLSDHAKKRLRQRKIKPEWIIAVIENPDKTENDAEDYALVHALKTITGKKLENIACNLQRNNRAGYHHHGLF